MLAFSCPPCPPCPPCPGMLSSFLPAPESRCLFFSTDPEVRRLHSCYWKKGPNIFLFSPTAQASANSRRHLSTHIFNKVYLTPRLMGQRGKKRKRLPRRTRGELCIQQTCKRYLSIVGTLGGKQPLDPPPQSGYHSCILRVGVPLGAADAVVQSLPSILETYGYCYGLWAMSYGYAMTKSRRVAHMSSLDVPNTLRFMFMFMVHGPRSCS